MPRLRPSARSDDHLRCRIADVRFHTIIENQFHTVFVQTFRNRLQFLSVGARDKVPIERRAHDVFEGAPSEKSAGTVEELDH